MGPFTEQLTQQLSFPVADLPPANYASCTVVGSTAGAGGARFIGPVDMMKYKRIMGKLSLGVVIGSTCAVNAQFLAGANTCTGDNAVFSQITSGPTLSLNGTPNTFGTIELRADQLPANTRYVVLSIGNLCGANMAAELIGGQSHYSPANQYDACTGIIPSRTVSNL